MYKIIKRLFDFSFALTALVLFLPLFIVVPLILVLDIKTNPFFIQRRPGQNEKLFYVIKFRTMNQDRDAMGNLLSDADRLTRVGKLVRKLSLDEIPQLINVVLGNMSFVGPRPLLIEYLPLYNQYQRRRHEVKPGITGWAQVNGRNNLEWQKRFELDVYYVDNQSFQFDLRILIMTILKVVGARDVNQEGEATVRNFTGN